MIILGIETSCDETAAAVVQNGTKILSNAVASSTELHAKTGGIIPEIAAREQLKCILPVIKQALKDTKILRYKDTKKKNKKSPNYVRRDPNILVSQYPSIDAIAVTIGPGLIGSLLIGVETSRTLSLLWQKPIVPVNHLKAHLYANWLETKRLRNRKTKKPRFPAVGLVVSGGHTDLILMKNHNKIKWLGGTRDDAAGECFDKCSRLLGLGYPGGPAIEKAAAQLKTHSRRTTQNPQLTTPLPRPMLDQENFDFSFSGLKTAVLNKIKSMKQLNHETIEQLAFRIQEAITDVLVTKALRAAQKHQVKSILLGGGVAANTSLRSKLKVKSQKLKVKFFAPAKNLSTDNAAIIASCAYFNYHPLHWRAIKPKPNLHF